MGQGPRATFGGRRIPGNAGRDFFNFSEAKAHGEDIRFATSTGTPLAYQIDQWDAAAGKAGIWVRIPKIKGNARQEIKLYWGKADAESESSEPAVFNESNGYLSVWHMNDPVNESAAWKEDYPNIQRYYVFQIWPDSCSMGGNGASDKLRDVQGRIGRRVRKRGQAQAGVGHRRENDHLPR